MLLPASVADNVVARHSAEHPCGASALRGLSDLVARFALVADSMRQAFAPLAQLLDGLRPVFLQMAETIRRLPDDIREVVSALAYRGWYFSAEMDIVFLRHLQSALRDGNQSLVDETLHAWVESEVDNIARRAIQRFPHRAALVTAAVQAHTMGNYALSIPVLLIQVEGMCQDEFKIMF